MSDPIPSATTTHPESTATSTTASAEDRKAAAALSSLNTTEITSDPAAASSKPPSSADQEALGKAMSRLEIAAGVSGSAKKQQKQEGGTGTGTGTGGETKKKSVVKVSGEDVGLLVEQLDLSKVKATELLRAHEGDARRAIRAFVRPGGGSGVVV
ncbi:hypothetical protein BJX61DRAFT_545268 [Aspergillus egyptiacus]|nr:hypothetical protein BJX61DRAFT_545268 [Aspergillus egyptiacus]